MGGISRRETRGTRPAISHRDRVKILEHVLEWVQNAVRCPGRGGRWPGLGRQPPPPKIRKSRRLRFFLRCTPCGRHATKTQKNRSTRPLEHARRVAEVGARAHAPEKPRGRPKRVRWSAATRDEKMTVESTNGVGRSRTTPGLVRSRIERPPWMGVNAACAEYGLEMCWCSSVGPLPPTGVMLGI